MIRAVYIVDDDAGIREELSELLAARDVTVQAFDSGEALLKASPTLASGCVILDLNLPGESGIAVQQRLREAGADHQVIMLTGEGDVPTAVQAMQAGASDFLLKPFAVRSLLASLEAAFGRLAEEQHAQSARLQAQAALARLSPRERDVLRELINGAPNKVIAFTLGLSTRTVEMYRGNLMEKLGVRSLPDAMRLALAAGFATVEQIAT
ncbi:two component transcriptional regulator, LuxR family [Sphingomonas guangdongensis]|uniref:Two component transcriptional regulator, LuxR family n=1 Tax=Sphingomonas guangdongensis TaxID=1141890 RepID=A0A285R3L6_9SPHN|nr:response regulator [Sphingomonas guangdongensis]SOB88309.1 two component transcriptional regulator, LuxR family [Sphingomonas guangdongensis]